jgi:tRNA(Ile)-lysidine synthase
VQNFEFIKKITATIENYNMLEKNDQVLIGLSGGADSMALFYALLLLREVYGLTVSAVHINHGLRDEEAARDEGFVREICAQNGILLSVFHFDIRKIAKENGLTLEEAGRLKRYKAFEAAAVDHGARKIALAHHLNDQAETVLMRMIRGTGTKGLTGIPAVRGRVIRPFYNLTRAEIERFMAENGLDYVTDSTNAEETYARNKLRLKLIPYLEEEFNPNLIKTLARMAQIAAEENNFIETMAEEIFQKCLVSGETGTLQISELKKSPAVLQKRVLRKTLQAVGGIKDVSFEHINDILKLADNQSGRRLNLPNGLTVTHNFGALVFSKEMQDANERFFYALPLSENGAETAVFVKETGVYVTAGAEKINCFRNFKDRKSVV